MLTFTLVYNDPMTTSYDVLGLGCATVDDLLVTSRAIRLADAKTRALPCGAIGNAVG